MAFDWQALNDASQSFTSVEQNMDPSTHAVDSIVYTGLYAKLSDIEKDFTDAGAVSVTIYLDTLVMDKPSFHAKGVVVVARSVDITALQGAPLEFPTPSSGSVIVAEWLVDEFVFDPLYLTTNAPNSARTQVPAGASPLTAFVYEVASSGVGTGTPHTGADYLQDLLLRPYALNSLKASFTAASLLMNSADAESVATAQKMLSWVVRCIQSCQPSSPSVPEDYATLFNQAAGLLVTLNVAPGAYFVPVLSAKFYDMEAAQLIASLQSYENNLNTLNVETSIEQAIEQVAGALQDVANSEEQPLQAQLTNIQLNIAGLATEIQQLRVDYDEQNIHLSALLAELNADIIEEQGDKLLNALFSLGMDALKAGFDVAELVGSDGLDIGKVGELVSLFIEGVKTAKEAIEDVSTDHSVDSSQITNAQKLIQAQQQIIDSMIAGGIIWSKAKGDSPQMDLPKDLAVISVDPALAWDNFLVGAQNQLSNVKENIGAGAPEAQIAANNYLAGLLILGNYGKAIATKITVYASLLAQAATVSDQIKAAQDVVKRWKALEAQAQSDDEKLAALKGVIQSRMDAVKRSIFLAWVDYRHAYFYLYFQEPPVQITLSMNAAQIQSAFAQVTIWIAQLLGDGASGTKIELPNENVQISFQFAILQPGSAPSDSLDVAILKPAQNGLPARLNWVIPYGTDQLKGILPNGGEVAIWITEANFFVDGITPNEQGRVIATISTSGSYENGLSADKRYSFVNKILEGHYAYEVDNGNVYDPWSVNVDVYATPTPYTQWEMDFDPNGGDPSTAHTLRMELTVSYKTN